MGRPHIPAPAPVPAPTPSYAPALVLPPTHYNNSLVRLDPRPVGKQVQPQLYPPVSGDPHVPPPSSGLLPNPPMSELPSPRGLLPNPPMSALPSPRGVNGAVPQMPNPPSQQMNGSVPPIPMNGPALLPHQLLSVQFPPVTPKFAFSPIVQPGVLGPGPQPPPSPSFAFPLSSSGFFPFPSPRRSD
ncbi:protein HAIKU1 [Gossypium australe]|uniref:Protein HAIKU1 n=1 Tax=Gossypium australe TaxID=47621 RepID=A0A5B6VJJ1_9ROSI|nr:protein HAIKU1 [Gossypium australe]